MAELKVKKLPVYEMRVEKDDAITGVQAVSLVQNPAIQVAFKMFSAQERKLSEEIRRVKLEANGVRYHLTGPLLIPNQQIYRDDDQKGEYLANTSELGIRAMVEKYSAGGFQNNTTLEHEIPLYGNTVVESWIIEDPNVDKAKALGFDLPKGTWMITMKINDRRLWDEEIVTGKRRGFSLEGFFKDIRVDMSAQTDVTKQKLNMPLNYNTPYTLEDGNSLILKESGEAILKTESGEEPAPDGSHTTLEGLVVLTSGGYVESVTFPKPASSEEMAQLEKEYAAISLKYAKAKGVDPATLYGADGKPLAKETAAEKKAKQEALEAAKAKENEKLESLWAKFKKAFEGLVNGSTKASGKKMSDVAHVAPTRRALMDLTLPSAEKIVWPEGETSVVVTDENGKQWELEIRPANVQPVVDPAISGEAVETVGLLMSEMKATLEASQKALSEVQTKSETEMAALRKQLSDAQAEMKALRSNTVPPNKTVAPNDPPAGSDGQPANMTRTVYEKARQAFNEQTKRS